MKYKFAVDLILTENCDRKCYYCTSYKTGGKVTIDTDYFYGVIKQFVGQPVIFSLLGGEPGLINNLDEVVSIIREIDNNFDIIAYSNSLVRKTHPFIIEDPAIEYREHLLADVDETGFHKFADYEFFPKNELNNYNVAVVTNNMVKHFEKYADEFKLLLEGHTAFKMVNNRSPVDTITNMTNHYKKFWTYVGFDYQAQFPSKNDRLVCSLCPPSPAINFETKQIHHCCMYPSQAATKDITDHNIKKLLTHSLFDDERPQSYCTSCMAVDPKNTESKMLCLFHTKKTGISINR